MRPYNRPATRRTLGLGSACQRHAPHEEAATVLPQRLNPAAAPRVHAQAHACPGAGCHHCCYCCHHCCQNCCCCCCCWGTRTGPGQAAAGLPQPCRGCDPAVHHPGPCCAALGMPQGSGPAGDPCPCPPGLHACLAPAAAAAHGCPCRLPYAGCDSCCAALGCAAARCCGRHWPCHPRLCSCAAAPWMSPAHAWCLAGTSLWPYPPGTRCRSPSA
jgi:hypothetical protein